MKSSIRPVGAVAAALMIMTSAAWAQVPPPAQTDPAAAPGQPGVTAPQSLEGKVVAVDRARGTMTIRTTDGQTHEFRGSAETLREYQVGDQIALTLRTPAGR